MIQKLTPDGYREMLPGITMQTLCHGDKTLMVKFQLTKGSEIPMHSHPHEQTGYLVSGHVIFVTETDEFDTTPGDNWCFLGDERHSVRILENSVIVEVFSPVRDEYLAE